MQAKRIAVFESNLGAGSGVNAILTSPVEPREEVNFHNIWASASVEPQDAGANCQGTWVLYLIQENTPAINFTDVVVNGQGNNQNIIACGVFSASNESVWNSGPINVKTSRNLNPGDSLAMNCTVTGITAGLASTRVMICAHTTRK